MTPIDDTVRSNTSHPTNSKNYNQKKPRPNSHKRGSVNGVYAKKQSQRDSNPCLHLERVMS
jgi:hypothetical protein